MIRKRLDSGRVNNKQEAGSMRKDIDMLFQLSLDRQILFNVKKCTAMHEWGSNKRFNTLLKGHLIEINGFGLTL